MLFSHESTRAQRTVWHVWIFIEKFSPDWCDWVFHWAWCDREYQRNKMVYNEHIWEPRFFWSFCFSLLPSTCSSPPSSPSPSSLNYHSISTSLPHTLTVMPFHALLLSLLLSSAPRVDPPPIPLCRIITMSPLGPTSAPCISPTRGADEEATTASSRRRRCLQTGLAPSTSTFTSQTGSPLLSPPAWTVHTLWHFRLDPEIEISKSVECVCGPFPECSLSLSGWYEYMRQR